MKLIKFETRKRVAARGQAKAEIVTGAFSCPADRLAVIVCDMWNRHSCASAEARVAEMAPFMNSVLEKARGRGALILHAPSDCMPYYKDTPQRRLAAEAPQAQTLVEFKWNFTNPEREAVLETDWPPGCSCDTPEPCGPPVINWTHQNDAVKIAPGDAISEDGREVHNLLADRDIENVLIMGVHANVCVLGRSFGIRQMVYLEKNVMLCRDLTDSFHRTPGRHFKGLVKTIEHIETYWCPTVLSTALTGKAPFRFKED